MNERFGTADILGELGSLEVDKRTHRLLGDLLKSGP